MIPLSSSDTVSSNDTVDVTSATETDSDAANESATDEIREAVLSELVAELGDAVVGSHIAAGVDITVRVTSEAWAATAEFLKKPDGFCLLRFPERY